MMRLKTYDQYFIWGVSIKERDWTNSTIYSKFVEVILERILSFIILHGFDRIKKSVHSFKMGLPRHIPFIIHLSLIFFLLL